MDYRKTAELLRPLVRQFTGEDTYGLAIGGAHAKGVADDHSDLDLYLYTASVLPNAARTELTQAFSEAVRDVVSWGSADPFKLAGTDFHLGELVVECALKNSDFVEQSIRECVEGVVRRDFVGWTITGFYNHVCLSDVKNIIPLEDASGMLARWKDMIATYPPKLQKSIIETHLRGARFWPSNFHYKSAIERCDLIYTSGIVQQFVHNVIQVLFAANEVYFPGEKKLAGALAEFSHAPARFVERVHRLIAPEEAPSVATLKAQQKELQDILKETEEIAVEALEARN